MFNRFKRYSVVSFQLHLNHFTHIQLKKWVETSHLPIDVGKYYGVSLVSTNMIDNLEQLAEIHVLVGNYKLFDVNDNIITIKKWEAS